jgi:hypothetical protein
MMIMMMIIIIIIIIIIPKDMDNTNSLLNNGMLPKTLHRSLKLRNWISNFKIASRAAFGTCNTVCKILTSRILLMKVLTTAAASSAADASPAAASFSAAAATKLTNVKKE